MSKAQLVITAVVLEGRSKSEVARDYDVSRYWVQQLVKRYETEGAAAFEPHSRRPHHNPRTRRPTVEDKIVRLRKTLDKQGYDAGAATIAEHLARDPAHRQSACGIHDLAHPVPPRLRGPPAPETAPLVLETLLRRTAQPTLASRCHPLAPGRSHRGGDPRPHRRPLPGGHRQPRPTRHDRPRRRGHLHRGLRPLGHTGGVLTETGPSSPPNNAVTDAPPWRSPWANSASNTAARGPTTRRPAARSSASTKPSKNTTGATRGDHHRRAATPDRRIPGLLQHHPPPPSTARRTPTQAFNERPKAFPTGYQIPPHYRVRHDKIDAAGVITIRYNSHLHHIGLSKRHAAPKSSCWSTTSTSACSTATPER